MLIKEIQKEKKAAKTAKEKPEKEKKNQLERFLIEHEEDHYNFQIPETFLVSSGSLDLDKALGGGFPPGIHRFGGSSEGGKTSESLEVLNNFLSTVPNSKVLIVKAEGRLSKKIQKRSGMVFVENAADWVPGTCYIFKCNIYDTVAQLLYDLVKDNPDNIKYGFLIDSLDGLILKADSVKRFDGEESVKVCGPNVLTKLLFKKLSLPISELCHLLLVITQIIAKPDIGRGGDNKDQQLVISGGGGNALVHFSNYILTFLPRFLADLILVGGVAPDSNNKANLNFGECNVVGHWTKVLLEKTEDEKSRQTVRYPIKYSTEEEGGRIWTELELKKAMLFDKFITTTGAWIYLSEFAREKMIEAGFEDVPLNFHGAGKFNEYISKPEVSEFWKNFLKNRKPASSLL